MNNSASPSTTQGTTTTSPRLVSVWVPIITTLITALLGFAGVCVTAYVATSRSEESAASTAPAVQPTVRVDSVAWSSTNSDFENAVTVTGEAIGISEDEDVWLFTSRADDVGGVYRAPGACTVNSDGTFTCQSWAGGCGEDGETFVLTAAIVTDGQAREIEKADAPYASRATVPHLAGTWTTHDYRDVRPVPAGGVTACPPSP